MTSAQRIESEAAQWAVRLSDKPLSDAEQSELDEWLAADIRHGGALLRAQAAWDDVDRLAALASGTELAGAPPEVTRSSALDADSMTKRRSGDSVLRWGVMHRAVAAAILVAVGAYFYLYSAGDRYATAVGVVDTVHLKDGSQINLNTDTQIHVRLQAHERRIELDRGEAVFQVAKDPGRPFVVHTGTLSVRAIGTTFAVRNIDRRTDVTVTEGVVELVDNSSSEQRVLRRVVANEHATVIETRAVAVQEMREEQTARQLAWREGLVKFSGEPLSEAVEQINRHNQRRIIIDDPALATLAVVGSFRANDPSNFAQTVAIALGAHSVDAPDAIHLRQR